MPSFSSSTTFHTTSARPSVSTRVVWKIEWRSNPASGNNYYSETGLRGRSCDGVQGSGVFVVGARDYVSGEGTY